MVIKFAGLGRTGAMKNCNALNTGPHKKALRKLE
jgi:hypothetical protein